MTATTDTSEAEALCHDLGIDVTAGNQPARVNPVAPASTNAVVSIQKLVHLHGREHVWNVLYALTQSENNRAHLTRSVIGAMSDVLLSNPSWASRLGDFCDALDVVDMVYVIGMAGRAPGIDGKKPEKRVVIATLLQHLIEPLIDPEQQMELVA